MTSAQPMTESTPVTLAFDAHGGDHGPEVTIAAAADALDQNPELRIIVTGKPAVLGPILDALDGSTASRISLHPASTVIAGDARPVGILRKGGDTGSASAVCGFSGRVERS